MAEQKIGLYLDSLGITADLDDEDMVADAIVALKVIQSDGSIVLALGTTDNRDWINQSGLLQSALECVRGGYTNTTDEGDR